MCIMVASTHTHPHAQAARHTVYYPFIMCIMVASRHHTTYHTIYCSDALVLLFWVLLLHLEATQVGMVVLLLCVLRQHLEPILLGTLSATPA